MASLGKEVAQQTVTLMAPSKTFNLAGLGCAFAVIENPSLRDFWINGSRGLIPFVNVMGLAAAFAAYTQGQEWLDQALAYLKGNRDFLARIRQRKAARHKDDAYGGDLPRVARLQGGAHCLEAPSDISSKRRGSP